MKLSEAIEEFTAWNSLRRRESTYVGYQRSLRLFCLYLRNPDVSDIELTDVIRYFKEMEELGWEKNSFLSKSMAIKKLFEYLSRLGHPVPDPRLIPVPEQWRKLPRICTEENFERLLRVIPKNNDPRHIRNRAMIWLFHDTGMRLGELLSLNVDDMKDKYALIRTEKAKIHRPYRRVFWGVKADEALQAWLTKRTVVEKDSPAVFLSCNGLKIGIRMNKSGVGEMLRRYSHRAQIPIVNPHSFRHAVGHRIIERGGSNADVANILGHASLQSTMIYTMMGDQEVEQRYRTLLDKE